jgi:uncharacterized lipoprotein YddW (UPF0748 family)
MYNKILVLSSLLLCCFLQAGAQAVADSTINAHPKRELRGVWVATVENIDWPQKPGEPTAQQQKELLDILDSHQKTGINAIMFQIRPAADAFYAKSREPWSKWLTGRQGLAPNPLYDPLEFAITEAHKRGMELHAWINPYRATKDNNYAQLSPQHITRIKPEWFFIYDGMKLFNPGLPEVREYIVQVVMDIIDNYDVDAIHMDDYFYPYKVAGQQINDLEAYQKYGSGFTNIDDWRRDNVNTLIKMLNDSIHQHNPRMKFGISPFSIWANKSQLADGSETNGSNSYFALYADSRKWVQEGWVDYINPQLYRPIDDKLVPFKTMVDWWGNNSYGRHVYIGQATYRIIENKLPGFRLPTQIPNQVKYLRANPRVQGSVYFSSKSLTGNPLGSTDSLRASYYRYPALPPVMLWRDSIAPNSPQQLVVKADSTGNNLSWITPTTAKDNEPVYGYVIYRFEGNEKINVDDATHILKIAYSPETFYHDSTVVKGKTYLYVVSAIDRLKNESERTPAVAPAPF